jgi:alpha/beta superfamily hydrolase
MEVPGNPVSGGQNSTVTIDFAGPDHPLAIAVLLHPHPHYGGNRFHPFVDGLYRRLPAAGVGAARFDFGSADADTARAEVVEAIDEAERRAPDTPIVVAGYSFGAGVAAHVDDARIVGWFLLAPQVTALESASIGADPRPKAIVVPEHDQYSPPADVDRAVAGWTATTVTVLDDADHFLGVMVSEIVDRALEWIGTMTQRP